MRKDKLRHIASSDANAKRHKHKHKCGDELCKHRKHKKRRKHKKHHHREINPLFEAPTTETKEEIPVFAEEEEEEEDVEMADLNSNEVPVEKSKAKTKSKAKADKKPDLAKAVNIKLNKLQWPLDEDLISSITEDSSGSSYVSIFFFVGIDTF